MRGPRTLEASASTTSGGSVRDSGKASGGPEDIEGERPNPFSAAPFYKVDPTSWHADLMRPLTRIRAALATRLFPDMRADHEIEPFWMSNANCVKPHQIESGKHNPMQSLSTIDLRVWESPLQSMFQEIGPGWTAQTHRSTQRRADHAQGSASAFVG